MYKIGSFEKVNRVAVLCRGRSLSHINRENNFDNTFIVGQFNSALLKIGKCLKGKKVVSIINKSTTKVNEKIFKKIGIKDIQCNFTGWKDKSLSEGRKKLFRKIKSQNPSFKVHVAPPGIRERRPKDKNGYIKWATTGVYGVDLACFWEPEEIWIFGLDFYESKYFCKEKVVAGSNKHRTREMLYNFKKIVERDSNIHFTLFTKSTSVKKWFNNLTIVKV